jgi:superfamily II DNA or RNA helicase
LSATPFKFGGKDKCHKYSVKGYFGPILKIESEHAEDGLVTTQKLQEAGILSPSDCYFYPVHEPDLKYDIYQDAVTNGIANNFQFHDMVRKLALKKCPGRTLIIVERIAHGDALANLIPGALWVQGQDDLKARQFVIDQLQKSKKDVVGIATQGIFNAGINVFVHNLINAAGGKAEHIIAQRLGRGLRPSGDKDRLKYYDFYFYNNEYLEKHSKDRVAILKKEGHKVEIKEEIDF